METSIVVNETDLSNLCLSKAPLRPVLSCILVHKLCNGSTTMGCVNKKRLFVCAVDYVRKQIQKLLIAFVSCGVLMRMVAWHVAIDTPLQCSSIIKHLFSICE